MCIRDREYTYAIQLLEKRLNNVINKNAKELNSSQLQNLLNKIFEDSDLTSINANELRDLSVHHFSQKGADVRSLQALRQSKQLRRLQSLNEADFNQLQKIFKNKTFGNFKTFI